MKNKLFNFQNTFPNNFGWNKIFFLFILILSSSIIWGTNALIGIQVKEINHSLIVLGILKDSPGDKAGLCVGDKILKVNNVKFCSQDDLNRLIATKNPGEIISLQIQNKQGKIKNLKIALENRNRFIKNNLNFKIITRKITFSGITSINLTDQLLDFYNIENGLLISRVEKKSPASQAGIKAGDIIISVNNKKVFTSEDFENFLNSFKEKDKVVLKIKRKNRIFNKKILIEKREQKSGNKIEYDVKNNVLLFEDNPQKINIIDLNDISEWFKKIKNDTTKTNLNIKLKKLQEELNKIKNQIGN